MPPAGMMAHAKIALGSTCSRLSHHDRASSPLSLSQAERRIQPATAVWQRWAFLQMFAET